MKFNRIKVDEKITKQKGIEKIEITRLNNVVAFIGKNGCGKSRILDILEHNLFEQININRFLDNSIVGLPHTLKSIVNNLEIFKEYFFAQEKLNEIAIKLNENPEDSNLTLEYKNLSENPKLQIHNNNVNQLNQLLNQFNNEILKLKSSYLRKIEYSEIQKLQETLADLNSENILTFESLIENVNETVYDEFKSIHKSALKYLSKLPNQLTADYMDCLGDKEKYEKRIAHKRYLSLKKLINDFLNKNLTWERRQINNVVTETGVQSSSSGIWKLDDRDFNYNEFSDGEKTLFSYALLFFLIDMNPKLNIKNSIILIDEPELHLHPDSEIDLINALRNTVGENGQLIFATHSISILSSLNYDEIFMVKKGKIKYPSQATIGESLSELINLEERVNKLSDFLSSIATWTFVNFMSECFSNPDVIETSNPNDPQIESFKIAINESSSKSSNLLLDFGAGKGRVYEQLKTDYDFIEKINYSALEPDKHFSDLLKKQGAKEVYTNHSKLPKNHFDFILLCNVLHEIPINEWKENLNSIIDSLKNDGFLIIIEAKILTKGERIGKEGFILLDIEEMKVLFELNELPTSIKLKGKEELITSAIICKSQLKHLNNINVKNTLIELRKNTLNKIIKLREEYDETNKNNVGFGRKNAFLSQLHINSQIAELSLNLKK